MYEKNMIRRGVKQLKKEPVKNNRTAKKNKDDNIHK